MKNNTKYCIGVMSGTSLDGLDIAYIKLNSEVSYQFKILKAVTIPYHPDWKKVLKNGFHLSGEALTKLDAEYGIYLGKTINKFIAENNIENINFIASHGHTIYHNPSESYTLQIGNGPYINTITGLKTICDFRTQDVALGGQGAPLVPILNTIIV